MHYIVFDLEWNQCPEGKEKEEKGLPFEIVEIGAVKLDENFRLVDTFHTMVKPQVYRWIHEKTREVIHLDYKNLLNGLLFPRAVTEFLKWCGEDRRFCTWGDLDLLELQRNMKYYNILGLLPGPVIYYDVQKLFGIYCGEKEPRRSLQYAMETMGIECKMTLHRALVDAWYTGEVMKRLKNQMVPENSSIDVYQNPKRKPEEITVSYGNKVKFISREFASKERALREKGMLNVICPICQKPVKKKIRWFAVNARRYVCVSSCPRHGLMKGKIRFKSTDEKKYYVIKTIELTDKKEAKRIQEKQEVLRLKRKKRKEEKK